MRPLIEELGVKLIGAVPECPEAQLESRHLGLTLPNEQKKLRVHMEALADRLEQCLDIPKLLALAGIAEDQDPNDHEKKETNKKNEKNGYVSTRRIGVAQDEVFCFYYQENLEFLRQNGWEIVTFSPLHDQKIPENLDALLLGGGYPELYARELSENKSMLQSIRIAGTDQTKKIKILAECGGFLYLHRTLEDPEGKKWQMVGLLDADAFRTKKLSRFGYITLKTNQTNPALLPDQMSDQMESKNLDETENGKHKEKTERGENDRVAIRGHEFHYWDSTDPGTALLAEKPLSSRNWACMHVSDRMIAGFPHLYYRSDPDWILNFLNGRACAKEGENLR